MTIRLCVVCSKKIGQERLKYVPDCTQCTVCWLAVEKKVSISEGKLPLYANWKKMHGHIEPQWCGDHFEATRWRNGEAKEGFIVGFGSTARDAWTHYWSQCKELQSEANEEWKNYRKVLEAPIEEAKKATSPA